MCCCTGDEEQIIDGTKSRSDEPASTANIRRDNINEATIHTECKVVVVERVRFDEIMLEGEKKSCHKQYIIKSLAEFIRQIYSVSSRQRLYISYTCVLMFLKHTNISSTICLILPEEKNMKSGIFPTNFEAQMAYKI